MKHNITVIFKRIGTFLGLLLFCFLLFLGVCMVSTMVREKIHTAVHGTALEKVWAMFFPEGETDEHDHDHDAASEPKSKAEDEEIALSPQALKNCGIDDNTLLTVSVGSFAKSLTFPAMVVDRPGRSVIKVPSPGSGVISRIDVEPGVSVEPGVPLFEIALTQQELIQSQSEFLTLLQKRDINDVETKRLEQISADLAPKSAREVAFQRQEIESAITNQRNILRLQGLSEEDINTSLEKDRKIVRSMTVVVPPVSDLGSEYHQHHEHDDSDEDTDEHIIALDSHPLQMNSLLVEMGQQVALGESLCQLGDLCQLVIEGKAFAFDEELLTKALVQRQPITATFEGIGGTRDTVENLKLRSVENRIDPDSRTLTCYVDLPNRPIADEVIKGNTAFSKDRRYITWRFKPGQRCELYVPFETIEDCIVVPVEAIARDLNETSVFEWVGNDGEKKIWRKREVHVLHQTKSHVVLANDGSVFPGVKIASQGASNLLSALNAALSKPKSGSGVIDHGDHVH